MSQSNNAKNAAALIYDPDDTGKSAPIIVASGMGYVAQKIVDVAMDNNVPIYQDDSLATLLSQFEAGREIPQELFQAIVDIYVYFLKYVPKSETEIEVKTE